MKNDIKISEPAAQALYGEEAIVLYSELRAEGYSLLINKKEYGAIAGCSISAIDLCIKSGMGIPDYKKMGTAKNSKILFSLISVANYLASCTVKTV